MIIFFVLSTSNFPKVSNFISYQCHRFFRLLILFIIFVDMPFSPSFTVSYVKPKSPVAMLLILFLFCQQVFFLKISQLNATIIMLSFLLY